jgi:hypothetical protein
MFWRVAIPLFLGPALCTSLHAAAPPPIMLWAWERPGELRALPTSVGVAFLAATIHLRNGCVQVVPRFQPLQLEPGAYRMAVTRIESSASTKPLSATQRKAVVEAIADVVRSTRPDALQIDFDARASERAFYAAVIRELRPKIGTNFFLSVTALVSWCGENSWLNGLPVDEVVPMTFEMGAASASTETLLRSGGDFENELCRGSIGVAAGDISLRPRHYRRTYVFAYQDWTGPLARSVLAQLK